MAIEKPEELAKRISAASKREGLAESTFCVRNFGDSRLFSRLQNGSNISLKRYEEIIEVIGPRPSEKAA